MFVCGTRTWHCRVNGHELRGQWSGEGTRFTPAPLLRIHASSMPHRLLILTLMLNCAPFAQSGVIIAPTSAVINRGGPGYGFIEDTHNQNGLLDGYVDGVTDFDTYIASNPLHSTAYWRQEWFANWGGGRATITYDFGSTVRVDRFALWNEEASGVRSFNLLASTDGSRFTRVLRNAIPTNNTGLYTADVFSFDVTEARYFRFRARGPEAGAGFNAAAIGEIAFRQAPEPAGVPEPALLPVFGLGLIAVAGYRRLSRTRRKCSTDAA